MNDITGYLPVRMAKVVGGDGSSGVVMKLTGGPDGSYRYTCRRQRVTDFNTFAADADVTNYLVYFVGLGTSNLPSAAGGGPWNNKYVWAIYHGLNGSNVAIYHCYEFAYAGGVFPITLSTDGGSNGSSTAAATYTYTVTDAISGASLGTTVNPTSGNHKWVRPTVGAMKAAATFGYAHYNSSGALVIGWINEVPDQAACA